MGLLTAGQHKDRHDPLEPKRSKIRKYWIAVNTFAERPHLELEYICNGDPIRYKIYLISVASNIDRGRVWYFLVPAPAKDAENFT